MTNTQLTSFSQCVSQLRDRIDVALRSYTQLGDGCPENLREAISYSLLAPGKRLRPMLVLLAAEACGGSTEAAMPAACAVEMVHAYSLVHDDLPAMDDDDLRRGQPTCHRKFGEATAILAGDALLTMAFEVLAGRIEPPEVAAACCAALAEAAGPCGMVGGQVDDVDGPGTDGGLDELESIHNRKTGAVIRVSLRLGALVARADAAQLAAVGEYGRRLGLAFQITDDLLDVRSDEATTGKRVGKDADRGKLTFPGLLGVDRSARRAEQLITEACEALVPLGARAESLEALARYVLERNR
ncbi:MAG: polyprenyl synthetase family protein [Planctomycetota bacterium]|jgi:geranylgeranyl diphosphate synthase type II